MRNVCFWSVVMNLLFGKYGPCASKCLVSVADECREFQKDSISIYSERIHNFKYDSSPLFYDDGNSILCALNGYIQNIDQLRLKYDIASFCDCRILIEMYLKNGIEVGSLKH